MTATSAAAVDHELVLPASRVATRGATARKLLAVDTPLDQLLPHGGLARGEIVTVTGATSLAIALLARTSREGAWCAAVRVPHLGLAAAADLRVDLSRLLLVPDPGNRWTEVITALIDAVDVLALRLPPRLPPAVLRRLTARVRTRDIALLLLRRTNDPPIEGATTHLTVTRQRWQGLDDGHGHLQQRHIEVEVTGRGAATRPRTVSIPLPGDPTRLDTPQQPDDPAHLGASHLGVSPFAPKAG